VERSNTSLPFWYPVVGAPAIVALGSLLRSRLITRLGVILGLAVTGLIADIGRRPAVPGANDNLTAVAVILAIARALRERPVQGLRVLLVSCGSEESLQEGVIGFARRHFPELRPDRTSFLVLDTVGSPRLILVEAEGTLKLVPYSAELKNLISECAAENEIPLIRGTKARSSTDACVPNRYGYPTALIASFNQYKALSNYHWPTDTADNVDYDTVAECTRLTEAVVRRMASDAVA
jgi:Zn-dependent M28 family amino/carboxypeptidase